MKFQLNDNEQTKILDGIKDSEKLPKLRTYKLFKTSYRLEPYLNLNLSRKTYSNIARFRLSSHNLKIETGRHNKPKTPVEERICDKCSSNNVEDEIHCLLTCDDNANPRVELMDKISNLIPNFNNLDKGSQFKSIMEDKRPAVIQALGSFLNKVMK